MWKYRFPSVYMVYFTKTTGSDVKMKKILLSAFLKRDDIKPFLLGAFLSRIMPYGEKYFYAYSAFRQSNAVYKDDFDLKQYASELVNSYNQHSGFYNWEVHSKSETAIEIRFYIENDLNISVNQLYVFLYKKLLKSDWVSESGLTDEKADFIRGFMEPRGSIDTSRKLIAQDYFYNNRNELKKALILTNLMELPIEYANFNARNLQPQYVSGENKRNTQFRINLYYFASKIGFINEYKALVFEKAYGIKNKEIINGVSKYKCVLPNVRSSDSSFINYINFFSNFIYEKQLSPAVISELREKLGFSEAQRDTQSRNKTIVSLFDKISEDKCAVCGTTQTYLSNSTGKQYFEIHHVISYKNGAELDNIANLVKLCPTCHRTLKKNSSSEQTQKEAINKILHNHQEVLEFAKSYLGIDDISELTHEIWTRLG